ncbi:Universal stress protein UspA [Caenispirillum salinarum AK4]|uniref:Universal stress protein UspA n=1 Tax=Caenispirillum salinarum AK4 TaxID=1238182 RepID=K9HLU0_9PROT|nr:universal stress protein [Caenispirillum salinarum]EKV29521.1 Universal stress protein UspA [Caenispirillum salinarum AK4]
MLGIRHIVVGVDSAETARAPLKTAFLIAAAQKAHVQALHARPEPVNLQHLQDAGLAGTTVEAFRRDAAKAEEEQAQAARDLFNQMRGTAGLAEGEGPPGPEGASARFVIASGAAGQVLAARARTADLVVLGRGRGRADPAVTGSFQTVLTAAARPVLLAPEAPPETVGRHVVVGWNDSPEAMRALSAALPILGAAESVTVVRVVDPDTGSGGDTAPAEEFMAWHGVPCRTARVARLDGAGASLLRACKEHDADLLVMGGSTHSRLRELVVGGATRHVLRGAGLPVLLAH